MSDVSDDFEPDECDHEDYAADILTGRAECYRCGHRWHQSAEEIQHERAAQRAYDEWCQRENRREWLSERWWGRLWLKITDSIAALCASNAGRET